MKRQWALATLLWFGCSALALAQTAEFTDLRKQARAAEKEGDLVSAYLLYAQAAANNPKDRDSWARSLALRRRATSTSKLPLQGGLSLPANAVGIYSPEWLTLAELKELERILPPPQLAISNRNEPRTLELSGDSRVVWEVFATTFGFQVTFDGDYQPARNIRLELHQVGFDAALQAVQLATDSLLIPAADSIALVARDTTQKRQELELTTAISIPLPEPVLAQEAQELARAVQQLFDIPKFVIDSRQRLAVLRGPASKINPARLMFEELMHARQQMEIEVRIVEVNHSTEYNYGLDLPGAFAFSWLQPTNLIRLSTLGLSTGTVALGVVSAQAFARFSDSTASTLSEVLLRSNSGQEAQFHVGDRYPIITAGYYGADTSTGNVYRPPPTFNFEDLGIVLKMTPFANGDSDTTLAIDTELKVLTGQALNGIPVIATRKLASQVRLKNGEWAVVSGLISASEARTLSGIVGISQLPVLGPLFRNNSTSKQTSEAVIAIRPRMVSASPSPVLTGLTPTGSETRPRSPVLK